MDLWSIGTVLTKRLSQAARHERLYTWAKLTTQRTKWSRRGDNTSCSKKKVFWSWLQDDVLERDRRSLPPGGVGHGRLLTQSHPGEEPPEAHWSVCLLANSLWFISTWWRCGKKEILKTNTIGFEIKLNCLDHICVVYEFAISEDEQVLRCRKKWDYAKDIKKNPKIQKPAYLALCLKSPSKNILNHQMKLILPLI